MPFYSFLPPLNNSRSISSIEIRRSCCSNSSISDRYDSIFDSAFLIQFFLDLIFSSNSSFVISRMLFLFIISKSRPGLIEGSWPTGEDFLYSLTARATGWCFLEHCSCSFTYHTNKFFSRPAAITLNLIIVSYLLAWKGFGSFRVTG